MARCGNSCSSLQENSILKYELYPGNYIGIQDWHWSQTERNQEGEGNFTCKKNKQIQRKKIYEMKLDEFHYNVVPEWTSAAQKTRTSLTSAQTKTQTLPGWSFDRCVKL